jgi:hypothetical protein
VGHEFDFAKKKNYASYEMRLDLFFLTNTRTLKMKSIKEGVQRNASKVLLNNVSAHVSHRASHGSCLSIYTLICSDTLSISANAHPSIAHLLTSRSRRSLHWVSARLLNSNARTSLYLASVSNMEDAFEASKK